MRSRSRILLHHNKCNTLLGVFWDGSELDGDDMMTIVGIELEVPRRGR